MSRIGAWCLAVPVPLILLGMAGYTESAWKDYDRAIGNLGPLKHLVPTEKLPSPPSLPRFSLFPLGICAVGILCWAAAPICPGCGRLVPGTWPDWKPPAHCPNCGSAIPASPPIETLPWWKGGFVPYGCVLKGIVVLLAAVGLLAIIGLLIG